MGIEPRQGRLPIAYQSLTAAARDRYGRGCGNGPGPGPGPGRYRTSLSSRASVSTRAADSGSPAAS